MQDGGTRIGWDKADIITDHIYFTHEGDEDRQFGFGIWVKWENKS